MKFIKKVLPRSLFGRSLMIILVPAILLQVIMTIVFLDNHWKKMTIRYSESIAGEVALIVHGYKIHHQATIIPNTLKSYFRMDIHLEDRNIEYNRVISEGLWEGWVVKYLNNALSYHIDEPYEIVYDTKAATVTIYVDIGSKTVAIEFPDRRIFTSSSYIFLLWMVLSSVVLSFISLWFMRNQVRPIRKLAVAADRFGRGLDAGVFKPTGAREVRQASKAFLVMRERLQRQIDQRTTMLAGISHDLRTPLTRLKLGLSMIDNQDDAKDMKHDIDDMERMINGYLEFVRGEGDEATEQVDIINLVQHVIEDHKTEKHRITFDGGKDRGEYLLSVRPMALERCISNIVRNAIKYAPCVFVSVSKDEEYITITIDDNGDGIPENLYDEVFKPFYRMDKARNSETGGVGLGMSIAKDIALSHGGDISLSLSSKGGLKVNIILPL